MDRFPDKLPPELLERTMLRDRYWLRARHRAIAGRMRNGHNQDEAVARWLKRLNDSLALRALRQDRSVTPVIDDQLPIGQRAAEIGEAIREHPVVVVSGETGSGKSTQLPLICMQLGLGEAGFVGHTQPRRIAARGVASRIAEQTGTPVGDIAGYKIRFGDQTGPQTRIKVMTDGILLAETSTDRFLNQYEAIIVDEAHERSLNIDFLLGYLKRLLSKRDDLKLVITSATIDTQRFADHFAGSRPVPVIEVSGRTWPVEIEYRPPETTPDGQIQDLETATLNAIVELAGRDQGDMLVFLPTEQSIRSLAKKLRSRRLSPDGSPSTEIVPLYARLSGQQQNSVFHPGPARRVVLATNVAESSITVPRIRYVVDQGLARISRYAPRSKVQRLPIEPVSRASADQRAGRCGRIGPGLCVRMYSDEDYLSRPEFTTPEIRRTGLASVILQTESLHLGPIAGFPFVDPPGNDAIRDGYRTLHEIGAVDDSRRLTRLGKQIARLPVDPRLARMMHAGAETGCLQEILVIAAALEIQDPRIRPAENAGTADQVHRQWQDADSDFVALLNLWDWLHEQKQALSNSRFRKACTARFLSFMLVQQWMDLYRQLKRLSADHRLAFGSQRDNYGNIHRSLLAGLLSGVAQQSEGGEYKGAGGLGFRIWPGSGLARGRSGPAWILAAEIVETSRRFGRICARIDPAWIEPLAGHLVRFSHSEPHWSRKRQSATAWEKVSLFGLPIVPRRAVRYASIDPAESRRLFIEHGLVEGELKTGFPFLQHNRQTLEEIQSLAARTRQREFVIDDYAIAGFYHDRLPGEAVDVASLSGQLQSDPELDARLRLTATDLVDGEEVAGIDEDFPDSLNVGNMSLPLQYHFAPGAEDDGVNVQVPPEALARLHENQLGWSVPGLLRPRIVALIRSLPKSLRRSLVPAPDTADRIAAEVDFGSGPFDEVIARHLSRYAGQPVTADMFRLEKIDDSLKVNVQVRDEQGQLIAQGRDLRQLKTGVTGRGGDPVAALDGEDDHPWIRDGVQQWDWDEFPEQVQVRRGHTRVPLFPAIISAGQQVRLRLLDQRHLADRYTRDGLANLYRQDHRKLVRSQVRWLPLDPLLQAGFEKHLASCANHAGRPFIPLDEQLGRLIARLAFVEDQPIPRTREAYEQRQSDAASAIGVATQKVAGWLPRVLELHHRVELALPQIPRRLDHAAEDIRQQLGFLLAGGSLNEIPPDWLAQYPRYLEAILVRLERMRSGSLERDREATQILEARREQLQQAREILSRAQEADPELDRFAWMIQEFRVSLFAQHLGTRETVSEKRLDKQWSRVSAICK